MSYNWRDIPDSISDLDSKVNQFIAAKWNPEVVKPPNLVAKVWNNMFGPGGSVTLEVDLGERAEICSIRIDDNADAREVVQTLEYLIEEWNEDPYANFSSLVLNARGTVLNHAKRQLKKYQDDVAKYEAGDWN